MNINKEDVKDFLSQNITVDDLERIKAEWFDEDCIIAPADYIFRYNSKGRRYYIQFNDQGHIIAPSQTTVSHYCLPESYYLTDWRVRLGKEKASWVSKQSSNYGTFFHVLCGTILRGESIRLDDVTLYLIMAGFFAQEGLDLEQCLIWYKEEGRDLKKDLYGFVRFCQDYKVKPLAIEFPLMHPEGLYATTIDFICKMTPPLTKKEIKDGIDPLEIVALGDIKSGQKGFFESNEIQLVAGASLWNLLNPQLPVERTFNIGCHDYRLPLSNSVTPYKFKDQSATQYAYKWPLFIEMFHGDQENKPQITKIVFKDVELSINSDLDVFEEINAIEQLKRGENSE